MKNSKAYAKERERIIDAIEIDASTRLIVNSLVGSAKEKFNMYN